jgi:hypothetical protein
MRYTLPFGGKDAAPPELHKNACAFVIPLPPLLVRPKAAALEPGHIIANGNYVAYNAGNCLKTLKLFVNENLRTASM